MIKESYYYYYYTHPISIPMGIPIPTADLVIGPGFEPYRERLCLSRQSLRYAALGTGCALLLQCLTVC